MRDPDATHIEHMRSALVARVREYERTRTRRRRSVGLGCAAFVMCVALMIAPPVQGTPSSAYAATPPTLRYTPIDLDLSEVSHALQQALGTAETIDEPRRESNYLGWFVQIDGDTSRTTRLAPHWIEVRWNADGSGVSTTFAASTRGPEDLEFRDTLTPLPNRAAVTMRVTFGPDQPPVPTTDPPGATGSDLRDLLHAYTGTVSPTAFDMLSAIEQLLLAWTITDDQHSALIQLLAHVEGVTIAGEGVDRGGRAVFALRAERADGAFASYLLVSKSTGRIVGIESTRLRADTALPAGAVVSYTLWQDRP